MIKLLQHGKYRLIETKSATKILKLNGAKSFAWINARNIGEILISTFKEHVADYILCIGKYRLYEVREEPKIVDGFHLELFVGDNTWQGYILPTGLPTKKKNRNRIIPTKELLTKGND